MSASHQGVFLEHAAVPSAQLNPYFAALLIGQIKTMAGGANIGARSAAQAFKHPVIP